MAYFIPEPTTFSTVPQFDLIYGPPGLITGFEIAVTGNTTFTVQPGFAASVNDGLGITYPSILPNLPAEITVDVSVLASPGFVSGNQIQPGVSGVFPVAIADLGLSSFTTFPVYILGDESGKNSPIVVVATGNNFIPGDKAYSSFRRIGWVFIDDTTSQLISFIQSGHFMDREYMFADGIQVLTGGTATSPTLVDLSLGDGLIVPGPTSKVKLNVIFTPNAQADLAFLTPTGLTGTAVPYQASDAARTIWGGDEIIPGIDPTTGHAGIDYSVDSASDDLALEVIGFTDSLRVAVV